LRLLCHHLADTPLCTEADFTGIGFEVAILRLLGVEPHGHRLVTNVFDLVDGSRLGQGTAGSVVVDKLDFETCRGARRERDAGAHGVASSSSAWCAISGVMGALGNASGPLR